MIAVDDDSPRHQERAKKTVYSDEAKSELEASFRAYASTAACASTGSSYPSRNSHTRSLKRTQRGVLMLLAEAQSYPTIEEVNRLADTLGTKTKSIRSACLKSRPLIYVGSMRVVLRLPGSPRIFRQKMVR